MSLIGVACVAAVMMSAGWWWQWRRQNIGIVDVLWALGVGGAALLIAWRGEGAATPRILLALMGGLWGLRLAWHLWRRVRHEAEDGRYQNLRAHWHGQQGRIFAFFLLQAGLVVLFALPFVAVAANPRAGFSAWSLAAVLVWIGSVAGEAVADQQLARFRSNPANHGKTCRAGLWRYSRHPNYFFEWLHGFSYLLLAVGSPQWWLALSGPLLMYVFLRWLSGIPHTEKQALRTRGEDYRDYQRSTPMLFPWFPKPSAHSTPEVQP